MTDTDQISPRDEDGLRAAEYVLRLLPAEEEAAFEARLAAEPELMAQVNAWTTRLSGMDTEFAEEKPRAAVKTQLMGRLFGEPERKPPFWERLGLWQGLSFASLALAGFLAWQSLQVSGPQTPGRGPLFVSEITAEDASLRVLAVYDSTTGELQINRTAGQAPSGRVLELWAIAEGRDPVSLGVLPDAQTADVAIPEEFRAQMASLTLAITDEPPGGGPGG